MFSPEQWSADILTPMNIDSTRALVLISALPLAACQPLMPSAVPSPPVDIYIARGNEPGWMLKMNGSSLDYLGDYGETKIKVAAPEVRSSFNGMRYISDRLTVDITYSKCTDDMSGKGYPDTVTVMADGKQVRGCGGRELP